MKKACLVGLAAAVIGAAAQAADLEAGRLIAESQCAACHGKDGKTPADPSYPIIAGQYEDYLLKALNDYHGGMRNNAIMAGMAKPLSKRDRENLAAYFARQPGPLVQKGAKD